jgi:hypothetical protein
MHRGPCGTAVPHGFPSSNASGRTVPVVSDQGKVLDEALRRRADLMAALERVEAALSAPTGREQWFADARREIASLRDALDAHVDVTEGDDGLFAEVLDAAPRLAHQIDVLRKEHDEIDEAVEELLKLTDSPIELRDRATSVLGRIVRHRQKGADLLYEAYEVDVSALD